MVLLYIMVMSSKWWNYLIFFNILICTLACCNYSKMKWIKFLIRTWHFLEMLTRSVWHRWCVFKAEYPDLLPFILENTLQADVSVLHYKIPAWFFGGLCVKFTYPCSITWIQLLIRLRYICYYQKFEAKLNKTFCGVSVFISFVNKWYGLRDYFQWKYILDLLCRIHVLLLRYGK